LTKDTDRHQQHGRRI